MKYNIITIEREYASGGREVGRLLAEKLGMPYYGQEILQMAAERYGVSPEYLEHLEETATNSFLHSLNMLSQQVYGNGTGISREDALSMAEDEIIKEIAGKGSAVIIGHCASHVLHGRKDVLNVFIHSNWQVRKERAIELYGIEPQKADSVLKQFDKRRSNYYNAHTGKQWDDMANYHIALDSGRLGIEKCAEILAGCCSL